DPEAQGERLATALPRHPDARADRDGGRMRGRLERERRPVEGRRVVVEFDTERLREAGGTAREFGIRARRGAPLACELVVVYDLARPQQHGARRSGWGAEDVGAHVHALICVSSAYWGS